MSIITCQRTGLRLNARKLVLLSLISLAAAPAMANPSEPNPSAAANVSAIQTLDIPPGDLTSALNLLGEQAGILLSYPASLTADLHTDGLYGSYSVQQALQLLLVDTGLEVVQQSAQAWRIQPLRSGAERENATELPHTLVIGQRPYQDSKILPGEELRSGMRNDLAESLSLLPSVRVDNTASSSLQQGDLRPAELSIRGAATYQNKLVLDGAPIDNLLDPGMKESNGNYARVAGHSQGVFVDPAFLGQIEVIDVNASAAEGGFTGGVVRAETRAYDGSNRFEISHRRSSDDWTNFHIDDSQEGEFGDGAAQLPTGVPGDFQPDFRKSQTSINGATRVGDVGIFAGFSEKRSTISQKQIVVSDLEYFFETGRIFRPSDERSLSSHSRTGVVRMDLLGRDYLLNASLSLSDFSEDSFLINYRDSEFESQHKGVNLSVNFARRFGQTTLDLNVNAGFTADQRDYQENVLDQYKYTSVFDGALFGGLGELQNNQRTLGTTLKLSRDLSDAISLNYGGELRWVGYRQDRGNNFYFNEYTLDQSQPLPPPINPGSWAPEDQFLQRRVTYQAGETRFNNLNGAVFGELAGEHQRWFWRTGMRAERDGWLKNTNIAPRLVAGLHLDQARRYRLTAGANRYYGKSFLAYRLREKEKDRVIVFERPTPDAEFERVDNSHDWLLRELDTPYDDEISLSLSGPLWRGQAGLTLVQRHGEDQVRTRYDSDLEQYRFENAGSSKTDQIDLYWHSNPMYWLNTRWTLLGTASWMDKKTDSTYLNGSGGYLATAGADDQVLFEGREISRYELPGSDLATPVSINLDLISVALQDRLEVRNTLAITDRYEALRTRGRDAESGLQRYEVERQGSTLRWDLSMEYQLLRSDASPYVRVDVINVTDNDNVVRSEAGVQLFGVGRQYWLELGYRF
ncbi:TonB-dependent receptor [Halopseudomonas salegens]|uniref:Outer membrane receptor proteins, mostly Fe transport n=1 Tax=Halopseudomonas salegens TaxID=1434072 RepID=A0A1H2FAA2_9GAMM|nr:TonB-dependent receptor [Halopseudomonas salegens]SDU04326.1 Outer membrane receptor proteins, mostly Fe transport [Halopseudomonas salegens]